MLRIAIGVALLVVALIIAFVAERRRRDGSPIRDAHPVPRQLYRADFPRPDALWLVALFSSQTCDSCASMREKVRALGATDVVVCDLEFSAERALHERYEISGVPMVLIADAEGVVRESFVGPATAQELREALSRARAATPGSPLSG
jgi:hypothetical protein